MPSCVEILQVEEQFDRRTRHGPFILPPAIPRSTPSSGRPIAGANQARNPAQTTGPAALFLIAQGPDPAGGYRVPAGGAVAAGYWPKFGHIFPKKTLACPSVFGT